VRVQHLQNHRELDSQTPEELRLDHLRSWIVFLGGPILWFIQFLLNSTLLHLAPNAGRWPLIVSNATFLLLAAACGVYAFTTWRRREPPNAANYQRARFMAQVGMLTSSLFFLLILAQGVPIFVFTPTET
jgi:hypothetical protein